MTDPATNTTPAVGGERRVPIPDAVARDYLLLALRLDQHAPGLVDGYYGPADLKATVDLEQLRSPADLAADAVALLGRIPDEAAEPDRRAWLTVQVTALKTQAEALAGSDLAYVDYVARCFDWATIRRDEHVFDAAAAEIDGLLPGPGTVADRLAAWDARLTVPPDRVVPVLDWLVASLRSRSALLFGLPDDEEIRIRIVRNQPWTAYNWYDGGCRSRFDVNADLPSRASELVRIAAHEAYPGHHLEHCRKEVELVERQRRLEASVLLINTPECLISEGLADLGHELVVPPSDEPDLLVGVYERAGLPIAADPSAAREAAERSLALAPHRRRLSEARVNAALMLHGDGASHDEVLAWLERVGRYAPDIAAKRLEFIEHPLWRTYVFVYHDGEALLRQWLDAVPEIDRPARFGRLLREQLAPATIAAELATTTARSATAPS